MVFVNPGTRYIKVYLRRVDTTLESGSELSFELDSGQILDTETGSAWDPVRGVATDGPLKGTLLQQVPYVTSYDWAWEDFFPHTTFYDG